jgi:uroporphyrinogen decarboxylase
MNSRERVATTLNHKNADRPPIDLGGAASGLNDIAYFRLKDYLNIVGDIEPFRIGTTVSYYDERILEKLDIDFRRLIAKKTDKFPVFSSDGSFVNEWGIKYIKVGEYFETRENPLANADIEAIKSFPWPKASDVLDVSGLKEKAKHMYENTDYALVARMPCWGLIDTAFLMRGMERFMIEMLTEPNTARLIIDKILESQMDLYSLLLDSVGEYVHVVETCDDLGSQNSLLFSNKLFINIVKPGRTMLNQLIKQKAPNAKIFMHCCGAIFPLIPEIIETGVDILNPLQPNAKGMEPERIKRMYGDRLSFHGCIDTQVALRGTQEDTRNEVQNKISILYQDGGYIVAPANHIMSDVPVENIITLYDTVKNYKP